MINIGLLPVEGYNNAISETHNDGAVKILLYLNNALYEIKLQALFFFTKNRWLGVFSQFVFL